MVNQLHHVIINNPTNVQSSIEHAMGADLVNKPGYAAGIAENLINRIV